MMDNKETMISAMLEADRKKTLGNFRRDKVLETKLQTSTPKKAAVETVEVEFTPSGMTDVFVDSWFSQVSRVFRGSMSDIRPVLTGDDTKDKTLFGRYLETIFWRKLASVDRSYSKGLQELRQTVDDVVQAPALFTNAVNCIGIVTVNNLALRLQPKFASDYDWKDRILGKEDFIRVANWIEELTNWGFQAYDGFNATREGNLDFMLMVVAEEQAVDGVEADITLEEGKVAKAGEGRACQFVIKSQRAASNVIALYRYFFHNKKIEFLSDTRLTYSYSTYESTQDAVEYIIEMMIWENNVPSFLGGVSSEQAVQSTPVEEQDLSAE